MYDVNKSHLAIFLIFSIFTTAIFIINPIYGAVFNMLSCSGFILLWKENGLATTLIIASGIALALITIGLAVMKFELYSLIPYGLWLLLLAIKGTKLKDKIA